MVIYVCRSLYPKNSGLKKKTLFWALNVDCRYKLENPTSKIFFATTLHSVPILQLIVIMFKFYNVTMLQLLPCYNYYHITIITMAIIAMLQLLPCYNCYHVAIVTMLQLLPCYKKGFQHKWILLAHNCEPCNFCAIPHNSAQRNSEYITFDWSLVATPAAYWAPPLLNLPTSFLIICRVNPQSMRF